jgi:hypothetical protein
MNARLSTALDSLLPVSGRWRRYLLIAALAGTVAWTCQISVVTAELAEAGLRSSPSSGWCRRAVKSLLLTRGEAAALRFLGSGIGRVQPIAPLRGNWPTRKELRAQEA